MNPNNFPGRNYYSKISLKSGIFLMYKISTKNRKWPNPWPKFLDFFEISTFEKNFDFWPKVRFLSKISIFEQKFDFWPKFRFLTKSSICDKIIIFAKFFELFFELFFEFFRKILISAPKSSFYQIYITNKKIWRKLAKTMIFTKTNNFAKS